MIVIFGTVFFLYKLDLVSMTFIVGRMVFSIQIQHDDFGIQYLNLQINHKWNSRQIPTKASAENYVEFQYSHYIYK